jgi:hypothetical protein
MRIEKKLFSTNNSRNNLIYIFCSTYFLRFSRWLNKKHWPSAMCTLPTCAFCLWLYSPCGTWPLFQFLILYKSVGLLGRGISPSQGRYLHTEQHKQRINAHTSMPRVGFEPTIPVFERAKTVHVRLKKDYETVEETRDQQRSVEPLMNEWINLFSIGL